VHELGNISSRCELEEKMMIWLRDLTGLPGNFEGVIQDSASTLHLRQSLLQGKINRFSYKQQRIQSCAGTPGLLFGTKPFFCRESCKNKRNWQIEPGKNTGQG